MGYPLEPPSNTRHIHTQAADEMQDRLFSLLLVFSSQTIVIFCGPRMNVAHDRQSAVIDVRDSTPTHTQNARLYLSLHLITRNSGNETQKNGDREINRRWRGMRDPHFPLYLPLTDSSSPSFASPPTNLKSWCTCSNSRSNLCPHSFACSPSIVSVDFTGFAAGEKRGRRDVCLVLFYEIHFLPLSPCLYRPDVASISSTHLSSL